MTPRQEAAALIGLAERQLRTEIVHLGSPSLKAAFLRYVEAVDYLLDIDDHADDEGTGHPAEPQPDPAVPSSWAHAYDHANRIELPRAPKGFRWDTETHFDENSGDLFIRNRVAVHTRVRLMPDHEGTHPT